MIKLTELMVGNWVYNTYHKKAIQLTPYDFFTHSHNADGSQRLLGEPKPVSGRDFEPIPLTPEILEKNGWKKVGEDERTGVPIMQIEYDGNAFWWTEMNGECGCEDVENEDGEEKFVKVFSCVQVCYVHELQHALKLCRIEKEIVL